MAHWWPENWDQNSDGYSTDTRRNVMPSGQFDNYGFRARAGTTLYMSDSRQAWYTSGTENDEILHGEDYTVTGTWTDPLARTTLPNGDIDLEFVINGSTRVEVPWFALSLGWFYNTAAPPGDQNLRIECYDLSDTLVATLNPSGVATEYVSGSRGRSLVKRFEQRCSRIKITHINRPTSTTQSTRNPFSFALYAVVLPDFYPSSLRQMQTYTKGVRANTRKHALKRQRQITP